MILNMMGVLKSKKKKSYLTLKIDKTWLKFILFFFYNKRKAKKKMKVAIFLILRADFIRIKWRVLILPKKKKWRVSKKYENEEDGGTIDKEQQVITLRLISPNFFILIV